MKVALLTAGKDPHYALGLAAALANAGIDLEVVGNSEMSKFAGIVHSNIEYFDLRGDQATSAPLTAKVFRILIYYARLIRFSWQSPSRIFHILWPNKFIYFDRTILNIYFRSLGKKLVFTAHNVNTEARDLRDSALNRATLRFQYFLMDHIFVHTSEMRDHLTNSFGVSPEKLTVLTFPINNVTPRTTLTGEQARMQLGIPLQEKVVLFFGNIAPYKGLEDLVQSLPSLRSRIPDFRVFIVGNVKNGEDVYLTKVQDLIQSLGVSDLVEQRITYIAEEEVEKYFKSADLLILPYRRIFQSGVLFLSYSFGLPVVSTDAGSLRDEIIEGETGFVCRHDDPENLADQIDRYFRSDLFANLESRRSWIINHANKKYSWDQLAEITHKTYEDLSRYT